MTDRRTVGTVVAGMLVANSAPHLATAVAGHEHLTPLAGRHSSPAVNLAWGLMNLGGGLALVRRNRSAGLRWDRSLVAFEVGCVGFAAWMAGTEGLWPVNSGDPA